MTHQRFIENVALSIAVVAIGLVGCGGGSTDGNNGPLNPAGTGGSTSFGGAPGGGAAPVGNGGVVTAPSPGAGGYVPPTGTGGSGVVPPMGSGGTVVVPPGSGGAPGGGAPNGGAPGTGGTSGTGDPWTTSSNLDANGKLIAPAAGQGFQISTPEFSLNPGQEVFKCFHAAMGNQGVFDVGSWESQMAPGSHHFILYRADSDTTAAGTLANAGCTVGFGGPTWLYTSGSPHSRLPFPDGVAMELVSNQRMLFDMHYINTGTAPIKVHVMLNVNKVQAEQFQKAQAQVSFNFGIDIPPMGTQTVGGDCTPPSGAKYFIMSTHTHRRGIEATITRKLSSGMLGEQLVKTTNWDAPTAELWMTAPYLTFAPGEKFHYECKYQNDLNQNVSVGTSAATNEMCMAVTYFFPATSGGSCN